MSYRVTGAAAVVELDDGKPDLNTGVKAYLEEGVPLPPNAKPSSVEHLVKVGLVSQTPDVMAALSDRPPAKNANKADWVAFAVAQGAIESEADAMNKDDLVAAYGEA